MTATCDKHVYWWNGEYDNNCELDTDHEGDHWDGLSWFDDDNECTDYHHNGPPPERTSDRDMPVPIPERVQVYPTVEQELTVSRLRGEVQRLIAINEITADAFGAKISKMKSLYQAAYLRLDDHDKLGLDALAKELGLDD